MSLRVRGIATTEVERFQSGGPDTNRQVAQLHIAGGGANTCRHCLSLIADGEEMLILNYRPFSEVQRYAETGPIFLNKNRCEYYDSDHFDVAPVF